MDGSASSAEDSIPVRELLFNSHLTWEDGTPEIIPGKKTRVLFCREADAGSQKHHTSSTGMTHLPGGLDGTHAPQSGVWWSIIFLLELPHFFFFFFGYSGSIHLDFSLLWFSLCFHNLSAPGWSGFRQAATSAGSHRVHVLMEEMWPEPMSPHPRKGSDSTQDGEMYRLYLYRWFWLLGTENPIQTSHK